jgi:thioesterase domain-containing protein
MSEASTKPAAGRPASALVRLRKGGAARPLFLIHPVGGNVLCYGDLVRRLGGDEPVHGFQSVGLAGAEPLEDLNAIAEHYAGLVRSTDPRGPYRLAGWSMGGVIAFEMARRLTAAGGEVELVGLLDSLPPGYPKEQDEDDDAYLLWGLAYDLGGITGKVPQISREDLNGMKAEEGLALLLDKARAAGTIAPWFGMAQAAQLWKVYRANVTALRRYRPAGRYAGALSLWVASPNYWAEDLGPQLGWEDLAEGGVEARTIEADHYGLLRPPAVEGLAEQIGRKLRVTF